MRAGRALLASTLCLVLILQVITFVPASAVSFVGEWTGKIDGDFTGDSGASGNFKHSADLTFVVAKDGSISGEGTGWEVFERGGGYLNGRSDNVTFKIRGEIVDYDTGEARLRLEEITPITYPVFNDQGTQVFVIWPFYNWEVFYIELREGARVDNDAFQDSGSGDTGGTDEFVITGGGGSNVECPVLIITPTMPPSSDPRNLAGPTGTASYRFEVAWEGTTPVKVNFDIQGGSGSVNPSFAFNPANMQTSPINVIMDVATSDAEEGEYPLTVDAWVIDPDTGEECHAEQAATVTLVVSNESRASALEIVKQFGDVTITPEETEAGQPHVKVETGNGGVTFTVSNEADSGTTIALGTNTKVRQYSIPEDIFEETMKEAMDDLVYQELERRPTLKQRLQGLYNELEKPLEENLSCFFGWLDEQLARQCSGQGVTYIENGELWYKDVSGFVRGNLMISSDSVAIPTGTELTMSVQEHGSSRVTTVTLLEGSAIVVNLVSETVQLVNAGEKYSMETSFAGQSPSSTNNLESFSSDSVSRWWQVANIQIDDFATAQDIETGGGSHPVNRTSVFSDHDDGVWTWVEFINVPASTEHVIDFKWYRPDGSLYRSDNFTMIDAESYEYWPTYGAFDLIGISGLEPAEKPGRWKVEVYYDGDFVKEISFYIAKNTLIKNQSVTYALVADVVSDNKEFSTAFENGFASGVVGAFAGAENINGIDDIEWMKTTILDNSAEGRIQDTLKLKGQASIDAEQRSLSDASLSSFIPTIGIDEDFTIQTGFDDPFPSQLGYVSTIGVNIGGSNIEALVFSGNKKLVEGDASADIKMISYYEKDTGILVHTLISGTIVAPEIGSVKLDFVIKGTKLSIPTTLTISSISSEIQQNQDVSVSGTTSPPVNEGQVVLTYEKNDATDEPIKRTVAVTNGTFSDTYKMDKDGTYSVSAEYLGSGAYLSSISDASTLTVAPSGCLIATAAFGSELTPQVQFLRNFRDNHIFSTAAGSSFMNVFNSWYYSFSPNVADYERQQPWLQQIVKALIYPLLGILTVSETAYASMPGEYGAITAGIVASSMIGAVYFWPAAFAAERFSKQKRMSYRVMIILVGIGIFATVISVLAASPASLMIATSLLVLTVVAISALSSARLIRYVINRITKKAN